MDCYVHIEEFDGNSSKRTIDSVEFSSSVDAKMYCEAKIRRAYNAINRGELKSIPIRMRIRARLDGKLLYEYFGRYIEEGN